MEVTINVNMDQRCMMCKSKGATVPSCICMKCVAVIIKSGIPPQMVVDAARIVRKEQRASEAFLQQKLGLNLARAIRLLHCLQDLRVVKKAPGGKWELRR